MGLFKGGTIFILTFLVAWLVGFSAYAGINDGLVAYYPISGNAFDESGNGNDGTVYGAVLEDDRYGNPGSAYSFDGVDDYIQIAYSSSLHPSVFSLSAWFNTTDNGRGTIITSDPDAYYCNHGYELGVQNGYGWFNTDPSSGCNDGKIVWSNNTLNDGLWHHMVAIFDGSKMMLYVDGVIQNNITPTSTYSKPNSYLTLGRTKYSFGGDQRYFDGFIDDIRIYNRALSEYEIKELFHTTTVMPWIPLLLFDE